MKRTKQSSNENGIEEMSIAKESVVAALKDTGIRM
jgi:hypothetical protein